MPTVLTSENIAKYTNGESKFNSIIDFSAVWCPPCQRMKPIFEEAEKFSKENSIDIEFLTCDVDDESDIAALFNIDQMPTVILLKEGKEVSRRIGEFKTLEKLMVFIGEHFDVFEESDCEDDDSTKLPSQTSTLTPAETNNQPTTLPEVIEQPPNVPDDVSNESDK